MRHGTIITTTERRNGRSVQVREVWMTDYLGNGRWYPLTADIERDLHAQFVPVAELQWCAYILLQTGRATCTTAFGYPQITAAELAEECPSAD